MSQRAYRSSPAPSGKPLHIAWWQAGPGDESICRRTTCHTPAEAAEVLAWLAADPANSGFECSWWEAETSSQIPF